MKSTACILSCLMLVMNLAGQNSIGIPEIANYSKSHYSAGMQNWDMVQDSDGMMYFANTEGLLTFDGTFWKLYPLPNKTTMRSVALGSANRIYAGGQSEFGYFSPDNNGRLQYTGLNQLVPQKDYFFSDIWDIVPFGDDVFFRAKKEIFQYTKNTVIIYPAEREWRFMGKHNGRLIAQDYNQGLMEFKNGAWKPVNSSQQYPPGFLVVAMIECGNDSSLVVTQNAGLYLLNDDKLTSLPLTKENPLYNQRLLNAARVNTDYIGIGTNKGCYFINRHGQVMQNLTRIDGLQNNTVLSLFLDKNSNLWLGLENGIDFIAYNNAIKHIYPQTFNEGVGYSSITYNNELYLGTSIGLYKVPINHEKDFSEIRQNFHAIPNIEGSAWSLTELNGRLLMGHHEGAYMIDNNRAVPISRQTGFWTFRPIRDVFGSSFVIAGNYNGLDFFQYNNNQFTPKGNLINFNEATRFLAIDKNKTIWIAHPYRGVFKIDVSRIDQPLIRLYGKEDGLPSSVKNHLYKIKDRIVVTTEQGVYEYDITSDSFMESAYFKMYFDGKNIRTLEEDNAGNIWFVEGKSLGVIDFSGDKPQTIYFPELTGRLVMNFHHINAIDEKNIIVGAEKGFYHINYEKYKKTKDALTISIGMVKVIGAADSIIFGGRPGSNRYSEVAHNMNSLHFEYSSAAFERQASLEYSYRLKGFEQEWSAWSKKPEKDYTNLSPGTYTFEVKAKTNLGNESPVASYAVKILPPWYQTNTAIAVYYIIGCFAVYGLYRGQRALMKQQQRKHDEEQKRLQYVHQLEMEKSEKEIIALRNQQLTYEIGSKNSELASVAMHLVQKGELLAKIKDELIRLKKDPGFDHSANEFKKIIRIFNSENEMDKDWEMFAAHFDNIHGNFLKALREVYPNLTSTDLKLSAYLRMNLTTKEIAKLMNISVRGVEISRYRLRKKLQIPTEVTFYNFFSDFSGV